MNATGLVQNIGPPKGIALNLNYTYNIHSLINFFNLKFNYYI